MGKLRGVGVLALFVLVGGCGGGGSTDTKWTGGITLSASGSWTVHPDGGGSEQGTETFNAHCTNNGDGVGEFTATFMLHDVFTDAQGMTSTEDVSGMADLPLTADNTHCLLGISDGRGNWGASFEVNSFDVSGMIVAGGVTTPTSGGVSGYDFALVSGSADGGFEQPQSGDRPAAVVGMVSMTSGQILGGSPPMVITTVDNGHGIPMTVSWSYAPLQ